jgi:hypothetical protein
VRKAGITSFPETADLLDAVLRRADDESVDVVTGEAEVLFGDRAVVRLAVGHPIRKPAEPPEVLGACVRTPLHLDVLSNTLPTNCGVPHRCLTRDVRQKL